MQHTLGEKLMFAMMMVVGQVVMTSVVTWMICSGVSRYMEDPSQGYGWFVFAAVWFLYSNPMKQDRKL